MRDSGISSRLRLLAEFRLHLEYGSPHFMEDTPFCDYSKSTLKSLLS